MMTRTRTTTQTEPCGRCRTQVTIGRYTKRSRHSGQALCDEHGINAGWTDGQREQERQARTDGTTASLQAGATRQYVDRMLEFRRNQSPEERARREALTAVRMGEPVRWEYRDLYGGADTETRTYGPEPDGVPVEGRLYETRWWNEAYLRTETRDSGLPGGAW